MGAKPFSVSGSQSTKSFSKFLGRDVQCPSPGPFREPFGKPQARALRAPLQPPTAQKKPRHRLQLIYSDLIRLLEFDRLKLSFRNRVVLESDLNRKEETFIVLAWKLQRENSIGTLINAHFPATTSPQTPAFQFTWTKEL